MAILTATGTIITPASNGDVVVTGVGFTPKLIMFIRAGSSNDSNFCMGAATATDQWVAAHFDRNNATPPAPSRYSSFTSCLAIVNSTGTGINSQGSLASIEADGFTVTFTATVAAFGYTWIAFGGVDLDVAVGNIAMPATATTDFSATGLSFQPKAIQVATEWNGGTPLAGSYFTTLGFATGAGSASSIQAGSRNYTPSEAFRYVSDTKILKRGLTTGVAPDVEISFKQFNTNGFTLTADIAPGSTQPLPYIAWGGNINVAKVNVTQPVGDGVQSITGVGFAPSFSFMYSSQIQAGSTDSSVTSGRAALSLGFSDGTNSIAVSKSANDNVTTSNTFSDSFTGIYTGGTSLVSVSGEATYANTADGFDLTWSSNDGIQRELFGLVIGSAGSAGVLPSKGFTYLGTIKVPALGVGVTSTNVPMLVKTADFTTAMKAKLLTNGNDLRLSSDLAGNTQLPIEIVDGLDVVWTRIPDVTEDLLYYVWGNKPAAVKEIDTAPFGRNAVWVDYEVVVHNSTITPIDSAGNVTLLVVDGALTSVAGQVGNANNFDGSARVNALNVLANPSVFTLQSWKKGTTQSQKILSLTQGDSAVDSHYLDHRNGFNRFVVGNVIAGIVNGNAPSASFEMLTGVYDGTDARLYEDGVIVGSPATFTNVSTGMDSVTLGAKGVAPTSEGFVGDIGEQRVIYSAITPSQISIEYDNQSAVGAWWIAADAGGGGGNTADVSLTTGKPVFSAGGSASLPDPIITSSIVIPEPVFGIAGSVSTLTINADVNFTLGNIVFSAAGNVSLPQPSSAITLDISKPIFGAIGSASLPQPTGSVSLGLSKPVFTSTITVSLPQPISVVSVNIGKPVFSSVASASLPSGTASISTVINKPVFSGAGSATLPNPSATINLNIGLPIFSGIGSVIYEQPAASIDLEIGTIVFNSTASASVPNVNGAVDATIAKPVFRAVGTISGFSISISYGASIKLPYTENVLRLDFGSNKIKL
jgi:hypothetical protein